MAGVDGYVLNLARSSPADEGVTVSELERLALNDDQLDGMQRWGYVVVEGGPDSEKNSESKQAAGGAAGQG